jgi:hypothetical protein
MYIYQAHNNLRHPHLSAPHLLSFRELPQNSPPSEDGFAGLRPPQLLPPLGHRTILGEVRAFKALSNTNPTLMDSNEPPNPHLFAVDWKGERRWR